MPTWRKDQLHGVIIIIQLSLCWALSRHLHIFPILVIGVAAPVEEQQYMVYTWWAATAIQTHYTEELPCAATASHKHHHVSPTLVWELFPGTSCPEQRLKTRATLPPPSSITHHGSAAAHLTATYGEKPPLCSSPALHSYWTTPPRSAAKSTCHHNRRYFWPK